ncbi:MAG: protein phosphatase CheZ [Betaproteobacteria bacterium]|nr:protein phosphatase CheZ [Betaproteobacteria bacterium]MDE2622347.1 protein phosphatase CheZ [Betaproteobacteria bacterium]
MTSNSADNQDSESLEALFDSIIASNQTPDHPASSSAPSPANDASDKVFNQLGIMTRTLHDSLRELGLDKSLESMASSIPDARDRLSYVAAMTEQAAERVLNATDAAQPIVNKLEADAHQLAADWQKLYDRQLSVDQFKALATRTHAFLTEVPKQTKATNAFLLEIMMAQDFQDLTGQVIKKIVEVTKQMEQQLLSLLVENAPSTVKIDQGLLNGPVINPQGNPDVVTSQDQVDELLESLGF